MDHVSLDFETLDTTANGVIMSIGAVRFDLDGSAIDDEAFYASVSIDSNIAVGRTISESTLKWWMQQPPEAQAVFFEPKQSLELALDEFSDWFGDSKFVWSKGADFDIAMMALAYRQFDRETPWEFYNARCMRTYTKLPGMKNVKVDNPVKHNALQDAIAQAKTLQAIQKKLNAALSASHPMVKKEKA